MLKALSYDVFNVFRHDSWEKRSFEKTLLAAFAPTGPWTRQSRLLTAISRNPSNWPLTLMWVGKARWSKTCGRRIMRILWWCHLDFRNPWSLAQVHPKLCQQSILTKFNQLQLIFEANLQPIRHRLQILVTHLAKKLSWIALTSNCCGQHKQNSLSTSLVGVTICNISRTKHWASANLSGIHASISFT